jgi:hypothetical protein
MKVLPFSALSFAVVISACAVPQPREKQLLPPNDLLCDRDADCTIITHGVHDCCWRCPEPPQAVSRLAITRHQAHRRVECPDGCHPIGYSCCNYSLRGFTAVCIRRTCQLQGAKPGDSPELICPRPDPELVPSSPDSCNPVDPTCP